MSVLDLVPLDSDDALAIYNEAMEQAGLTRPRAPHYLHEEESGEGAAARVRAVLEFEARIGYSPLNRF